MEREQDFTRREFIKRSALAGAGFSRLTGSGFSSTHETKGELHIATDLELTPRLNLAIAGLAQALTDAGVANRLSNLPPEKARGRAIRIVIHPDSLPQSCRRDAVRRRRLGCETGK